MLNALKMKELESENANGLKIFVFNRMFRLEQLHAYKSKRILADQIQSYLLTLCVLRVV